MVLKSSPLPLPCQLLLGHPVESPSRRSQRLPPRVMFVFVIRTSSPDSSVSAQPERFLLLSGRTADSRIRCHDSGCVLASQARAVSFDIRSIPTRGLCTGTYEPAAGPVKLPRPFPCGSLGLSLDRYAAQAPPRLRQVLMTCRKAPVRGRKLKERKTPCLTRKQHSIPESRTAGRA
jgi:hypothetical protein